MDVTPLAPYRRLTLLDLIGLVAASALGLGLWLVHARDFSRVFDQKYLIPDSAHAWINLGSDVALALAWLVNLRGLARPRSITFGAVACLAVVMATAFTWADAVTREYHENRIWDAASLGNHALLSYAYAAWDLDAICGAVALGWLLLWRVVGWRRAEGSLDRLGRGVGCWFLLAFVIKTVIETREVVSRMQFEQPAVRLDPAWLAFPFVVS